MKRRYEKMFKNKYKRLCKRLFGRAGVDCLNINYESWSGDSAHGVLGWMATKIEHLEEQIKVLQLKPKKAKKKK